VTIRPERSPEEEGAEAEEPLARARTLSPSDVALRPYQREALEAIRASYKRGVRKQLICLPTGTGKTVVFAQLPRFFKMKHRMLVLAHREELLDQARDKMMRANPDLRIEIEQGARHASADADVVIASVPTLGREGSDRILTLPKDEFFLFVVDEAHHAVAESYRRVLDHFGVFEKDTKRLLLGFTATPSRGDGQGLDAVFDEIVFARDLPEMMVAGYLSPVAGWRVSTTVDLSKVKTRMGDYAVNQLAEAVNIDLRNEVVVKAYRELLSGRKTICFCVDVAHAENLATAFNDANIKAAAVSGAMPRDERALTLERFRNGDLEVLTNCMVLTEGFDESSVAGILLARPTKSQLLYTQMIGRGTRLHPGKENVVVVDIVDATREHELVTLPTLFGLPSGFDLQGRTTMEAVDAFKWTASNRPWVLADRATSFDDLRLRCKRVELLDLETPSEIGVVTRFAWVKSGEDAYRLNLLEGERLDVVKNLLGEWDLLQVAPDKIKMVRRTKDLRKLLAFAEKMVEEDRKDAVMLVDRRSKWRKAPASEKQIEMLQRKGVAIPAGLTKGQASHLIAMVLTR
jgi:superfamily II DNA or RNA helicase